MRRLSLLVVAAALLGGCSDDDAGSPVSTTTTSPPTTTTTAPEAVGATLTEDWGCGYGFAAGNPEQTIGLVIQLSERLAVDQGRLPARTDLAGGTWEAVLREGEHLFANWCNDVIIDPQAEVSAELPVVEGTLEITSGRLGQECPLTVEAQLTGVVAQGDDGQRVEIGDLTVGNESWGCFAG